MRPAVTLTLAFFRLMGFVLRMLFGLILLLVRLIKGKDDRLQPFSGKARVVDGDSLNFGETRVRLFGIDAPELRQVGGQEARQELQRLVSGQTLLVEPQAIDRYGRTVARIRLEGGTDVGQTMVRNGYAIPLLHFNRAYAADQRHAKKTRAGLWATAAGITDPRQFRAQGH